jgi:hypothetical protein
MIRMNRTSVLCALTAAVVIAAACTREQNITTEPVGDVAFGATLANLTAAAATSNLPRGLESKPAPPIASATPATDSNRITLRGLDSLRNGSVYVVWVGNDSGTTWRRATGTLIVSRTDTSINAQGDPVIATTRTTRTGVRSWAIGGENYAVSFRFARTGVAGLANTDSMNVVLVTVENSDAATAPGHRRFLWARRSDATGTGTAPRVATFRFGNFAPRTSEQFVYATNGIAAIVPRGKVSVRGPALVIMDTNFYRPPKGFFYAAWAVRYDTLGFQELDNSVYLGPTTTPYPDRQSLKDADSLIVDPRYVFDSPYVIEAMATRARADTIAALAGRTEMFWENFGRVVITLENKASLPANGVPVRPGPAIVLSGILPSSVSGQ